ncbi:MAG TPA: type IX secretion system membrane protein PorP/SprF [Flavobacteriales bacterium]|nr:type IX secretion system membrane protein PorP/SprF [Flavobacteriales bacterium]
MKNFNKILATASVILALSASAQQEVMVSQYMFNGLFLNPAYAGSHGYTSSSLLHRAQWVQMEGAPKTSMMAIDGPLMKGKMGLGFTMVHDQIGVSRDLDMSGQYAYHIRTGANSKLSFGLRAGLSVYSARLSDLQYWDAADPMYQSNIKNQMVGKFGFGMYWYTTTGYIGLSVPTIYAADGNITMNAPGALDHYFTQHYYLQAGKVFPLGEYLDIKPSTVIKYQPNAPVQADINCNLLYRERIWFGAGYRTGDALVGMVEYQVSPQMRIGYAYDMNTSRLRTYNSGSHEVMLGIDFGKDLIKIKTPRYF